MAQVLVRDLDDRTVARLKDRAKQHHRSLQGEVKAILEDASRQTKTIAEVREELAAFRATLGNRVFSSSADLIREDRER